MNKKIFISITAASLIFVSCVSVEYIATGKEYSPLPEGEQVKILLASLPSGKYEEIGIARVKGGSSDKKAEMAKETARQKGGDGIIAVEKGEEPDDNILEFKIVRTAKAAEGAGQEESKAVKRLDYSNLKKASYKDLVKNYKAMKDDMYIAEMYPRKISKVPVKLKKHSLAGDKLAILTAENGKNRVYLVAPGDNVSEIKELIKQKEKYSFIYTPAGVYGKKKKYPVLIFIDQAPDGN